MKTRFIPLLCLCFLLSTAAAYAQETLIMLEQDQITVDSAPISQDAAQPVFLTLETQSHEDVPDDLKDVANRVVNITAAGSYRIAGKAQDVQIAVRAGEEDDVRLILDGADISCRTAPAIIGESARDPRIAGQYGLTIELADGSENFIAGSHTKAPDDDEDAPEYDGAIGSLVSLGFEGGGSLTIDADNEGIEVALGHMTINGGVFHIAACDDPLNVAEDGMGTLTVNDGYIYSAVKPLEGGEGDGIDSNGYIVFNGGTVINLAHPNSQDGGIDSDMGSSINGGTIVGAGNMYDPIEESSGQLFMMLEFGQATNDLVVVTDEQDTPVFAYDFPHDYMYIAFSTPQLKEGTYHVYLGGEIQGTQTDGLYTEITSYTPGVLMQHGEGNAQQRGGGMPPMDMPQGAAPDMPQGGRRGGQNGHGFGGQMQQSMQNVMAYEQALAQLDLNVLLENADLNELLKGKDLNSLLSGLSVRDLLTGEQIAEYFAGVDVDAAEAMAPFMRGFGGMGGGPRGMQSSAEVATTEFRLNKSATGFTNVTAAQ